MAKKTIVAWTSTVPGFYRSSMDGRFKIRHIGSRWHLEDSVQDIPADDFTTLTLAKRAAQDRVNRENKAMAEHRRKSDATLPPTPPGV